LLSSIQSFSRAKHLFRSSQDGKDIFSATESQKESDTCHSRDSSKPRAKTRDRKPSRAEKRNEKGPERWRMKSSPNSPLTCPGVVNFSRDISRWSATFQRRCPPHQAAISRTSRASLRLQIYLWHATPPLFRYLREILLRTACLSKNVSSSRPLDREDTSWSVSLSLSLFLVIDERRF